MADAQIAWGKQFIQGTELDGLPVLSAAAPFRAGRNGVEDYTNIAAGAITQLDTVSLYVFPNTIRLIRLTGADIKEWLERSAGQFNRIDPNLSEQQNLLNTAFATFNFDVIDGIEYEIDVTQPSRYDLEGHLISAQNERIKKLVYQGHPVDLSAEFLVVTNNFRASGGGNFPNIDGVSRETFEGPDENRSVLKRFLIEQSRLNPEKGFDPSIDGNWRFSPIHSDTKLNVVFRSSDTAEAKNIAELMPQITPTDPVELDENGFVLFKIDLSTTK